MKKATIRFMGVKVFNIGIRAYSSIRGAERIKVRSSSCSLSETVTNDSVWTLEGDREARVHRDT